MHVNQPFIPFIHHIWGETVLWGTVFIIQTSERMQYFTILQHKLHSFNILDDRSTCGLFKPLKKFPKSYTASPVLTFAVRTVASVWPNILELSYNIIKKLLCLFSFIKWFYRCVIFKSAGLIPVALWVLLQAMFTEQLKTNGMAIKITRETTNNQ